MPPCVTIQLIFMLFILQTLLTTIPQTLSTTIPQTLSLKHSLFHYQLLSLKHYPSNTHSCTILSTTMPQTLALKHCLSLKHYPSNTINYYPSNTIIETLSTISFTHYPSNMFVLQTLSLRHDINRIILQKQYLSKTRCQDHFLFSFSGVG